MTITQPSDQEHPRLPTEFGQLKRPQPATRLFFSRTSQNFGLLWIAISFAFLFFNLTSVIKDYSDFFRLSDEGVISEGTILKLEIDNSGDIASYLVDYQFPRKLNGIFTNVKGSASLSASLYYTLKINQPIEILFVASDPTVSIPKTEFGPPNALAAIFYIGASSLMVLIGLWVFFTSLKAQKDWRLLQSDGYQARAIIYDRWQERDPRGQPSYFVALVFNVVSPRNKSRTITYAEQNKLIYDKFKIGDSLSVRYLPAQPAVCRILVE